MDNAQMVEGCRRHDPKAQRALYDAVVQMSMGVCMRYANDRDEAQDMLQDGFVKVFESIGSLRDAEGLMAWVYNIMVNTCIDHHRRRRYWLPIDDEEGENLVPATFDADPFAKAEIVAAIQKLTPALRTVFNMCEVEGYSYDEVAKKMKTSNVAVRVALSRAKEQLRQYLTR